MAQNVVLKTISFICATMLVANVEAQMKSIELLTQATVFIKVTTTTGEQTGSGVLIESNDREGLIVTNSHVITADRGSVRKIECVVLSGTRDEFSVTPRVVAVNEAQDLAVLSVRSQRLPEPLVLATDVNLVQTLPLRVIGYPFGNALATSTRNPGSSISTGSISSIRKDDDGRTVLLQVDGSINPGNSGGPVVTDDGKLIGIAVAKVQGTEIGFAIPSQAVHQLLLGTVSRLQLERTRAGNGTQTFSFNIEMADPKANIREVSVLTCKGGDVDESSRTPDGIWNPVAGDMKETVLGLKNEPQRRRAKGEVEAEVDVSGAFFQIRLSRADGSQWFSRPMAMKVIENMTDRFGNPETAEAGITEIQKPSGSTEPDAAEGIQVTPVQIEASTLVEHFVWNQGGALCLISKDGLLRQLDMPSMDEMTRYEFGTSASYLGRSSVGLLIVLDRLEEVVIVDQSSFEILNKLHVPGLRQIACSRTSPTAYALTHNGLVKIDLRNARLAAMNFANKMSDDQPPQELNAADFNLLTMSPTGEIYAIYRDQILKSLSVDGDFLMVEDSSTPLDGLPHEVVCSQDGKIAVLSNSQGGRPSGDVSLIVERGRLSKWESTMRQVTHDNPQRLVFDNTAQKVYAQNYIHQLIVYDERGSKLAEYNLAQRGTPVKRFLVHPDGGKLCVLTEDKLMWVDLYPSSTRNSPKPQQQQASQQQPQQQSQQQSAPAVQTRDGVQITRLDSDAANLVPDMHFAEDGLHLWTLTKSGHLKKIRLPNDVEEQGRELGVECSYLGVSQVGLVVYSDQLKKIYVIDIDTLETQREIDVELRALTCSPASTQAFGIAKTGVDLAINAIYLRTGRSMPMNVIDRDAPLVERGGEMVKRPFNPLLSSVNQLALTPDGDFLFLEMNGQLSRMRISRRNLILEQATAKIAGQYLAPRICVSGDSERVALVAGIGNSAEGHPKVRYGTYIYDVKNLEVPAAAIETGRHPRILGFDVATHRFYAQNEQQHLIIVSKDGTIEKELRLDPESKESRQFLVHPNGNRLCVLTDKKLFWVEIGSELPPLEVDSNANKVATTVDTPTDSEGSKDDSTSVFREWTDVSGKFKVVARPTNLNATHVELTKEDGTRLTVPIARLSASDVEFLRDARSN